MRDDRLPVPPGTDQPEKPVPDDPEAAAPEQPLVLDQARMGPDRDDRVWDALQPGKEVTRCRGLGLGVLRDCLA